jgi:aldehyde dehydrogenase (NAD+)
VIRTADVDATIEIANDTEYDLSSAISAGDVERGVGPAKRIEAGMTHVARLAGRRWSRHRIRGVKPCGIGRFGGHRVIDEFTVDHWISVQHRRRDHLI